MFRIRCALVCLVVLAAPSLARAQAAGGVAEVRAELAELREMVVQLPTVSEGVRDLTARLSALETKLAELERQQGSIPDAVAVLDELEVETAALRRDLEYLRAEVADMEQPVAVGGAGPVTHDTSYHWETADGRYKLGLDGFFQPRFTVDLAESFDSVDAAGLSIRRARIGFRGHVGSPNIRYRLLFETLNSPALIDAYLDHEFKPWLVLRVGQSRFPFSRAFLTPSWRLVFHERAASFERLRYGRELGAYVRGRVLDDQLHYTAGVANGSGRNSANDNIDFALVARVEYAALGEYFARSYGDYEGTPEPSVVVAAGAAHDLVRVPETVATIGVGQRDVDADGVFDNIRVISSGFDAVFRYSGLEVALEGIWRHEKWGTILDHMDNEELSTAVRPSGSGSRNYLAGMLEASYFIMPRRLVAGGRVSHGRLPLLGLSGRDLSIPPAERLLQIDGVVQFFIGGLRTVGLQYSFFDYNVVSGEDPAIDKAHTFILETQLRF